MSPWPGSMTMVFWPARAPASSIGAAHQRRQFFRVAFTPLSGQRASRHWRRTGRARRGTDRSQRDSRTPEDRRHQRVRYRHRPVEVDHHARIAFAEQAIAIGFDLARAMLGRGVARPAATPLAACPPPARSGPARVPRAIHRIKLSWIISPVRSSCSAMRALITMGMTHRRARFRAKALPGGGAGLAGAGGQAAAQHLRDRVSPRPPRGRQKKRPPPRGSQGRTGWGRRTS